MPNSVIQLFAKPPIAGKVKTRLIPDIGEAAATAVYQHCLQYSLDVLDSSSFAHQIWLTEPSNHDLFQARTVHYQQGNDLGQKMYHAMHQALTAQAYDQVIVIGADCLDINHKILLQVQADLLHHDLVLVPANDGGYVLIAANKRIHPQVFNAVDWGSKLVLQQTLSNIRNINYSIKLMNPLRDIDRMEDLQHYPELQQYL